MERVVSGRPNGCQWKEMMCLWKEVSLQRPVEGGFLAKARLWKASFGCIRMHASCLRLFTDGFVPRRGSLGISSLLVVCHDGQCGGEGRNKGGAGQG